MKTVSPQEAVSTIKSGDRIYVQGIAGTPNELLKALAARAPELRDVETWHLHLEGDAPHVRPETKDSFKVQALFVGGNIRKSVHQGIADYVPVFLSEVPLLFRSGIVPLDYTFITVSPPDKHGFCTLGTSVEAAAEAVQSSKKTIAQVNRHMPRTIGDSLIHVSQISAFVEHDEPLAEAPMPPLSDLERQIGRNVASLIEDGACLQMGIGAIPNAVLAALENHKDLGIHTEMCSDGIIDLVKKGVITGNQKRKHRGKMVTGFAYGTKRLYDFLDDNPQLLFLDIAYVNDTHVIRQNPKTTAINSAIEVDITGQVCADSIGTYTFSGVGGQMDFMRGASLSERGKPIIALPSATSKGESRIVSLLKPGAGVVTTRAHVRYIVTEYGVADLYAKSLRERAKALIQIAHPDHREQLERDAHERFATP